MSDRTTDNRWTTYLTDELDEQTQRHADARGESKAEYLRQAVRHFNEDIDHSAETDTTEWTRDVLAEEGDAVIPYDELKQILQEDHQHDGELVIHPSRIDPNRSMRQKPGIQMDVGLAVARSKVGASEMEDYERFLKDEDVIDAIESVVPVTGYSDTRAHAEKLFEGSGQRMSEGVRDRMWYAPSRSVGYPVRSDAVSKTEVEIKKTVEELLFDRESKINQLLDQSPDYFEMTGKDEREYTNAQWRKYIGDALELLEWLDEHPDRVEAIDLDGVLGRVENGEMVRSWREEREFDGPLHFLKVVLINSMSAYQASLSNAGRKAVDSSDRSSPNEYRQLEVGGWKRLDGVSVLDEEDASDDDRDDEAYEAFLSGEFDRFVYDNDDFSVTFD